VLDGVIVGNNPVMGVDPLGLCREGVFYNSKGIPTGEVGLQSVIPTPDVRIGLDSPVGGVVTTLPFGSGGISETVQTAPSWNQSLGPANLKVVGSVNRTANTVNGSVTLSSPIVGITGNINSNGDLGGAFVGPQLNFPFGDGVNGFIGISWR